MDGEVKEPDLKGCVQNWTIPKVKKKSASPYLKKCPPTLNNTLMCIILPISCAILPIVIEI